MEMTVKERLMEFINYKKINKRKFCLACNLSTTYVDNMRVSIQPDKILNIAKAFPELNKDWLLTGEGEMLNTTKETVQINQEIGTPYYDVDFTCGFELIENDQTIVTAGYINIKKYDRVQLWINATGDSMKPLINNGDIIGIKAVNHL